METDILYAHTHLTVLNCYEITYYKLLCQYLAILKT